MQKKLASDTSWTNVSETFTDTDWVHTGSGNSDLQSTEVVFPGVKSSVFQDENTRKTYTIGGTEVTVNITDIRDSSPDEIDVKINGGSTKTYYPGEAVYVNGNYIRFADIVSVSAGTYAAELNVLDDDYSLSTGHYEYRLYYKNQGFSKPLYFAINGDGDTIPYVKKVEVNGNEVFDYGKYTGISRLSGVVSKVHVKDPESYKVFLSNQDLSGDYGYSVDYKDGVFSYLDYLRDTAFAIFFNGPDRDFRFENETLNLYETLGESENFRLYIKEVSDGDVRSTAVYNTVTTSNSKDISGKPFNVTGIEGFNGSWHPVTSFETGWENITKFRAQLNTSVKYPLGELKIYNDYDLEKKIDNLHVERDNSTSTVIFNSSEQVIDDSGKWNVSVWVETNDAYNDTYYSSWTVPWGDASVDVLKPANPITVLDNETFQFDLRVSCSGGPECFNENETWKLWPDPRPVSGVFFQ
ncbi:MAG: hypothetical protein ABEJ02_02975 [Candidatus Paceibacteria bacterium]